MILTITISSIVIFLKKKILFPTNSLVKLLSDSCYWTPCYRTVHKPITLKVVVKMNLSDLPL